MTYLINLLPWQPGYSGFGSYVQRVIPGLPGLRLQLNSLGKACLIPDQHWKSEPPPMSPGVWMRWLQRNSMVQHGLCLKSVLGQSYLQPEVIYSPFFDALLDFSEIPQLITCHDLTPLIYPNSRKAWLRYKFWQPRHLACARKVVAISRHVADQLMDIGMSMDSLEIVPNGIVVNQPPVLRPQSHDLLVIARHDANKNLRGLLRALAGAQRYLPKWRGVLRIVGRGVAESAELKALRRALPRPDGVNFINQLGAEALRDIVRSSLALLSLSLEEGFDYPVLESKAEGIPTILSDIDVHREFHQNSSLFIPPNDDGSALAECLFLLIGDVMTWKQLSAAGRTLACSLSVERQQKQILQLMDELH